MPVRIDRVLIDRQTIANRVDELAGEIADDFAAQVGDASLYADDPQELTIVPLLTGSLIFLADLIRKLPLMMRLGVLNVSAYPGKATVNRGVQIHRPLPESMTGKHVLIVDDILDSGKTIAAVRELIESQHPASIRICVLLRKDLPSAQDVTADYVGFDIPDEFVVGYGLDFDGYYRNLPEVVTLTQEAMC